MLKPIPYDASRQALYFPETQPVAAMTREWSIDAVAAEFSRLAYRRFENPDGVAKGEIERAIAAIGYGQFTGFWTQGEEARRFDAQGFAAIDPGKAAIVAFRGTQADSPLDILNDASIGLKGWDRPGRVHDGFWGSLHSILADVEQWLSAARPAHLIVTGHSLGAALATLLAARVPGAELVTFGSPRVGDAAFAASFAGRSVRRYVDCMDQVTDSPLDVTNLPPWVPLIPRYRHVDGQRYIDHRGMVHVGDPAGDWLSADRKAASAAFNALPIQFGNVLSRRLADHAPINYVSAVLGVRTGP